ncbi:MAG: ABC transporter permease subunit [Alphaproteobacteria bacterium]|nr:ABC transporter permease subunit [Alphaproteobacteria bacterium]
MSEGGRLTPFGAGVLALGFAFLYLPMLSVVIYSFNASRLVTVWGGFTLHWYAEAIGNERLIEAVVTTLIVATASATLALVTGATAALVLGRHGRFFGRGAVVGVVYAPLVLPEVILGLALLLLFVELDIDRGMTTVILAHAVFASAWVAALVQSRLVAFDRGIEEAAMDLGATPAQAFLTVTLPAIAPTLGIAWLLAFTLSVDDLVIAAFTSGPGATTLPLRIYGQARLGVTPEINVVSTLLMAAVVLGVLAVSALNRRAARSA